MSKRLPIADLLPQRSAKNATALKNLADPCESLAIQGDEAMQDTPKQFCKVGKRVDITNLLLTLESAAVLTGIPLRTIRYNAAAGNYPGALKIPGNGGDSWSIPLFSLPIPAQAAYVKQTKAALQPSGASSLSDDERATLWARLEGATDKCIARAERAMAALRLWLCLMLQGVSRMEAYRAIKREFNAHRTAFNRWQTAVVGLDEADWLPALVPDYSGCTNRPLAEWPGQSLQFFCLSASAPGRSVAAAYRDTVREAALRGWGKLPSQKTAGRVWAAIPPPQKAILRGDDKALKALSPTPRGVYEAIDLHAEWVGDGRVLDVNAVDVNGKFGEKGKTGRLTLYAFEEKRTRYALGVAFGWTLNTDLVRAAFLNASDTAGKRIPRLIHVDNGREVANNNLTGGVSTRKRWITKEFDPIGVFPALGIEVSFATVANGQSKPVERMFGTLARGVETRPEFRKAYKGHSPDNKPAEYDEKQAIPVESLIAAYKAEIDRYNNTPHRGDGMNGKTPLQVFNALAAHTEVRPMTPAMRRVCLLSVARVNINKTTGTFTIPGTGGATYWSQQTSECNPNQKGYSVRYNPNDLNEPVTLYLGSKIVAANVPPQRVYAGRNAQQASENNKAKRVWRKTQAAAAKALVAIDPVIAPEAKALLLAQFLEATGGGAGEMPVCQPAPGKVVALPRPGIELPEKPSELTPEQKAKFAVFDALTMPERTKKRLAG
ncbi:Mu-like prophage FluMu transposase A [Betaproteobacteria bacterium]|nr:Mu-like prophage FluMu transposase A [Betaproteobacteria bacterium]GHU44357.1 Mu-like prophage FluMu transposase A [Betaproteobacteria bacterium]